MIGTQNRGGTKSSRLVSILQVLTELSIQRNGLSVNSVQRQLQRLGISVSYRTVTRDLETLCEQGIVEYDVDNLLHVRFHLVSVTEEPEQSPQTLISLTGNKGHREVFIDPSQVSSVITEGDNGVTKISMKDRRTHLVVGEASDVAAIINRGRLGMETVTDATA